MRRLISVVCAGLILCLGVFAEEPQEAADGKSKTEPFEKKSFWFVGTSNYHLRLNESEQMVDKQLNDTFGRVLPRWKEPRTFREWCDEWRVWDIWGGYGRDINAKASWAVYGGGGAGTVRNTKVYYPLGVRMKLDADFFRSSIMCGTSVSYYPFDRPRKIGNRFKDTLAGTRPVVEMNIGYTYQTAVGDVRLKLPLLDHINIKDETRYHLFWTSPRAGIEIPLTEADSLNMMAGYLFFFDHAREFNGLLLEFFVRHRF